MDKEDGLLLTNVEIDEIIIEELSNVVKPLIQKECVLLYPSLESCKLTTLIDTFTKIIVNPPELDEDCNAVEFDQFEILLESIHVSLGLSENEIHEKLVKINAIKDDMLRVLTEHCIKSSDE